MLIAFPSSFHHRSYPRRRQQRPLPPSSKSALFSSMKNAPGRDRIHYANGSGAVFENNQAIVMHCFNDDFKAGPGPNFWVYLNTVPVGEGPGVQAPMLISKTCTSEVIHRRPELCRSCGDRHWQFQTVTIWCESFSVYIGSAALPKS